MDFSSGALFDWLASERVVPWIVSIVAGAASVAVFGIVKRVAVHRLKKLAESTATQVDDLLLSLAMRTKPWVFSVIVFYAMLRATGGPAGGLGLVWVFVVLSIAVQAALWGNALVMAWVDRTLAKQTTESPGTATTVQALSYVARVAVWATVGLLAVQNLGYDVTALMAGLGVGGIAVALAVQNVLGDLFAALSIALDKPFVIGDFVVVGEFQGTIEQIGLKTTRVRSLSGEQVVVSNSDMLSSRIRNFKRMTERRVAFVFGVTYQTPVATLEMIPRLVKEVVESVDGARFDRAHFKTFGASSLDFEVVYFVGTPDYGVFMDVQQSINLGLIRAMEAHHVDFAYPTQTLFVTTAGGGFPGRDSVATLKSA